MRRSPIIVAAACAALMGVEQAAAGPPLAARVCVLAYRGVEEARQRWHATAEYLEARILGSDFEIVALGLPQIASAAATGRCEFLLTNPGHYAAFEARDGATRIATLRSTADGTPLDSFAGVIFTRADRADVKTLEDLRDKRFAATAGNSFGGWWMAWRELARIGIDPARDLELSFADGIQDDVVYAVQDAKVDAGTVRSGQLERMAAEGKIELSTFRVLNLQPKTEAFPLPRSTRLYPEWPIAALPHTPPDLARNVTIALLQMKPDSPAAKASESAGWTVPLNYSPIHDLLRELRLPPYSDHGRFTLAEAAKAFWYWPAGLALLVVVMGAFTVVLIRLNSRLTRSQTALHVQGGKRIEIEAALRQSEHQFRALFEQSGEATFLLDPASRRLIDCNPAFVALLGYSREEARNLKLYDFMVDSHEAINARYDAAMVKRAIVFGERRYRRKDGKVIFVEPRATVISFGDREVLHVQARDITERRKVEQQLDRFFSLSLDMLCVADMETGCFLRVNNACERTLGYSQDEMMASPWIDLVHPEDRERTLAAAGTLAEGKPVVYFENRYRCKNGAYKWLAWSSVSVIDEGIIYAVARDVTDQKAAEWQLQEQNRKLAELLRVGRDAR